MPDKKFVTIFVIILCRCCTDLGDNDLELTIIQGISYSVPNPKDVDTYVKFEFPYPSVSISNLAKQKNLSDGLLIITVKGISIKMEKVIYWVL